MKITDSILELLKHSEKVALPGFGLFRLSRAEAVLLKKEESLLPPSYKVDLEIDYTVWEEELISYIATRNHQHRQQVALEVDKLAQFWKNQIQEGETRIDMTPLGALYLEENSHVFKGVRVDSLRSDLYGLQEISLQKLKRGKTSQKPYYPTYLWWGLLILLLFSLAVFFIPELRELVLGSATVFDNNLTK
ncbi:hypothetical protein [Planobacterium oryzisoli]|uniref:CCDC81-like prokaryotic HU domain-containing protein n=1 Tax=Planobacterium oryzisoli TaxID=2771435 RepID=A0A930YWT0_9FLAO|nr:hypothetical protein [Planobacterium oryzisoli]MBF5027872.1 hypothetical protein [Planobacterium oryzisoli]